MLVPKYKTNFFHAFGFVQHKKRVPNEQKHPAYINYGRDENISINGRQQLWRSMVDVRGRPLNRLKFSTGQRRPVENLSCQRRRSTFIL